MWRQKQQKKLLSQNNRDLAFSQRIYETEGPRFCSKQQQPPAPPHHHHHHAHTPSHSLTGLPVTEHPPSNTGVTCVNYTELTLSQAKNMPHLKDRAILSRVISQQTGARETKTQMLLSQSRCILRTWFQEGDHMILTYIKVAMGH